MTKYYFRPAIVLLLWTLLAGCEIINPDEKEPAYLRIERPVFATGNFGSDAHAISTAWVSVNNKLIGVYDLPASVPVLATGNSRVYVEAGVISDGQRATRQVYPFYTAFIDTINFAAGGRYSIRPEFTYKTGLQFPFYEDFEDGQINMSVNTPYRLTEYNNLPADSLYLAPGTIPNSTLGVVFAGADTTTEIKLATEGGLVLPQQGRPLYLEFNIRSTQSVAVGLEVYQGGTLTNWVSELTILPTYSWKKFYVALSQEASLIADPSARFRAVFATKPTGSGRDYIAIDNVRLVHYPF